MRKSLSVALVLAFALIGCDKKSGAGDTASDAATTTATPKTTTTAAGNACNHADTSMCVQWGTLSAADSTTEKKDCEKDKGAWVPTCPTANLLGTCTNPKKGGDIQMKFYKGPTFGTAAEAKKAMCSDSGDIFAAGK